MRKHLAFMVSGIAMAVGLLMYLLFRPVGHEFLMSLGLTEPVTFKQLPQWVVGSLPDGLWMFSALLAILGVWNLRINTNSLTWMVGVVLIGFGIELGQIHGIVAGFYDPMDLFLMFLGVLAAVACSVFTYRDKRSMQPA